MNEKRKTALKEWVEAAIIAAIFVTFVRTFFFQLYRIPTTSMIPVLMPGDRIFVSRLSYGPRVPFTKFRFKGFKKPEKAEVIVFVPPHDRKKAYIKRLIGVAGDRVEIKSGNIIVNDKIAVDPKIARNYYYNQGNYGKKSEVIVVPEGKYFFLGDNSISSSDGRFWGFADKTDIIGKAIFIWWPPKRVRMIE